MFVVIRVFEFLDPDPHGSALIASCRMQIRIQEGIYDLVMRFFNFLFYFCGLFLPFWIRIQHFKLSEIYADPDPSKTLITTNS
jgi:hypothetical protein